MRYLSSVLWIVPLALHMGYLLATVSHLPGEVGVDPASGGTATPLFVGGWLAVTLAANGSFAAIYLLLPRAGDRMLSVPGKDYWLADRERRAELIDRLRGVCETALLGLNVFFLAVYQSIYQTNVARPFVTLSMHVLIFFFMVLPLLVSVIAMVAAVYGMAAEARKSGEETNSGPEEGS